MFENRSVLAEDEARDFAGEVRVRHAVDAGGVVGGDGQRGGKDDYGSLASQWNELL